MYSGRVGAEEGAQLVDAGPPEPSLADDVGDEPLVARDVLAGDHRASRRPTGARASAASISPSSMRKPRILTWSSMRPRYSRSPFGSRRARSPER